MYPVENVDLKKLLAPLLYISRLRGYFSLSQIIRRNVMQLASFVIHTKLFACKCMNKGHSFNHCLVIYFFWPIQKLVERIRMKLLTVSSSLSLNSHYNRNEFKISQFRFSFDHFTLLLVQVEKEKTEFLTAIVRARVFYRKKRQKKSMYCLEERQTYRKKRDTYT